MKSGKPSAANKTAAKQLTKKPVYRTATASTVKAAKASTIKLASSNAKKPTKGK